MPKYNYIPEEDEVVTRQPMHRSKRTAPLRITTELPKKEYLYSVQRALAEPHRQVVAAAISAALAEDPVKGFKPSLGEMPVTLLTARASMLIFVKTSGGFQAKTSKSLQKFNDRITDFVDRTNDVRPTVSAEVSIATTFKLSDIRRHQRPKYKAMVGLGGEGADTLIEEASELFEELNDPKALTFSPAFELGFNTSHEATESFVKVMNHAQLAHNITAALRSDANPEGLLEFGPLEPKTP